MAITADCLIVLDQCLLDSVRPSTLEDGVDEVSGATHCLSASASTAEGCQAVG